MTFGELREAMYEEAGVRHVFEFRDLGPHYSQLMNAINRVEFDRGYTPDYERPGTPALCEMDLLTETEFAEWMERFRSLSKPANF